MAKILICDDEEGLRARIKRYALFEGHEVFEACDGMEAVELCRKETFDIIMMYVMMPELDGFSAVKEMRKTIDTPVIMLSAQSKCNSQTYRNITVPKRTRCTYNLKKMLFLP